MHNPGLPPYFAEVHEIEIDLEGCGCQTNHLITLQDFSTFDATITPIGDIYSIDLHPEQGIHVLDLTTGQFNLVLPMNYTHPSHPKGLVSVNDSIFYFIFDELGINQNGQKLYRANINSGNLTDLGELPAAVYQDLALFNGQIYSNGLYGYHLIDTLNPENSYEIVSTLPNFPGTINLTASPNCNILLGSRGINFLPDTLFGINILDGTVFPICQLPMGMHGFTSLVEYHSSTCNSSLDLDCDDSSGASGANYQSGEVYCLSPGVGIADDDVRILPGDHIEEINIWVETPAPDDPFEILTMSGAIPGISVSDDGTPMMTLTNSGGATIRDFSDALRLVLYQNIALSPTGGPREVYVQYTTASGMMSNIATAFIEVIELPEVMVDLGPDQEICAGESTSFDATQFGASYQWNTGHNTPSISASSSGLYIATVSLPGHCPGSDTAELEVLPIIEVSLSGDDQICDNENAELIISSNSPFPFDIEISADPGSPFFFSNVEMSLTFNDLPSTGTLYTITNVVPAQDACVELPDSVQYIEVFPSYIESAHVDLCDGDSIWLDYYWEFEAGMYEILYETLQGCDSVVNYTIDILPAVQIQETGNTCVASEAGVFITHLNNPNGCDTVVTTTISLLPLDTTFIFSQSCDSSQIGEYQHPFTGVDGCDSLVIESISLLPGDTTLTFSTSCDSSMLGVHHHALTGADGCDSLVIETVTFSEVDTTYTFGTSCDIAEVGVFEHALSGADGCDSLVIETITFSENDSTFILGSSCDPNDVGVFISSFVSSNGCDSVVTETISAIPLDTTYMTSLSCDSSQAGVYQFPFTGIDGCDSLVIETVTWAPSDNVVLHSSTCLSSEDGVFVTTLQNQYGCDSVITEIVALQQLDTTYIGSFTCDSSQTGEYQHPYTGIDGCDSLVIETIDLFPLPQLDLISLDYNGFDLSCAHAADGMIEAMINGIGPFEYLWSTGDTTASVHELSQGSYSVSITDGNGCMTEADILLIEPDEFAIGFEVTEPDCFGQGQGMISVQSSGGVPPYSFTIDGTNFQSSPVFAGLGEGVYQLTAIDANECEATELIWINVPLQVMVELGDNQVISRGDTAMLNAIINIPFDSLSSIVWSGIDSIECPECLTQLVAPLITTSYSISVTSADGCADADTMTVVVATDHNVFIPNIFSPNGDGINDKLVIYGSDDVEQILSFTVFDRWGNMVFDATGFDANDPAVSWDGRFKGELLQSGVYAFKIEVLYADGRMERRYGDVTLLR